MEKLRLFHQPRCPHCVLARRFIDELKAEDPALAAVDIELIDEFEQPDTALKWDYWYVPAFFLGTEKLHEGHAEKADVRRVLERAAL